MLVPCNYVGRSGEHTIPEGCIRDLDEQNAYVGEIILFNVLHNKERLDMHKFGDETIVQESDISVTYYQGANKTNKYSFNEVKMNKLEDESDFIQYG